MQALCHCHRSTTLRTGLALDARIAALPCWRGKVTMAPLRGGPSQNVVGGRSDIYVVQSYHKDSVDAARRYLDTLQGALSQT